MSFIRPTQGRKKRAFVRKRPQWDDSVSDLDLYRATPAEIRERREAHRSKNHIAVKLEKMRKEKQKQRSGLTNVEARQVAIMKEVLHDHHQLDTVLSRTDHMLSMVKDLFGDDAKKFTGHPRVTVPPGNKQSSVTSLPEAPEIRTRIEKLSESVMSQSALNDISDSSDEDSKEEERTHPEPISFQPRLDIERFQQFLHEEENRNCNALSSAESLKQADFQRLQQLQQVLLTQSCQQGDRVYDNDRTLSTISGNAGNSLQLGQRAQGIAHSTHLQGNPSVSLQGPLTPPNSERTGSGGQPTPTKSALNDTGKVKKSRRRVPQQDRSQSKSSSLNMTDMRQVLDSLQAELADFEHKTGRRSASDVQSSATFTGYTVALVTAVTKLTHYMKETELRLQSEIMLREQLVQDVRLLAVTTDSLTQELIVTQEEFGKLGADFQHYRQQVQGEMALLQAQVLELKHQYSVQGSKPPSPGKAVSVGSDNGEENFSALPDRVEQPSAAVLLSPLVRKTRVPEQAHLENLKPKRQTSLVDIPSLVGDSISQPQFQQQSAVTSAKPSSFVTFSASSSSTNSLDPPRLTQTLPVMATVNVPRPIPLVQTNVRIPLTASQIAGHSQFHSQLGPRTSTSTSSGIVVNGHAYPAVLGGTVTASIEGTRAMESQIAELNRQHAEAQQRLQSLLVQQKRQHDQLQMLQDEDAGRAHPSTRTHDAQQGVVPPSVSPPISPISHLSEKITLKDNVESMISLHREIKVAMPVVDLENSAGSPNNSL